LLAFVESKFLTAIDIKRQMVLSEDAATKWSSIAGK
jgi:hypothetical protein